MLPSNLVAFIFIIILNLSQQKDFYVTSNPKKDANCTLDFPCKFTKVWKHANEEQDVTIIFESGTYDFSDVNTLVVSWKSLTMRSKESDGEEEVEKNDAVILKSQKITKPLLSLNTTRMDMDVRIEGAFAFKSFYRALFGNGCTKKDIILCKILNIVMKGVSVEESHPIFEENIFPMRSLEVSSGSFKSTPQVFRIKTKNTHRIIFKDSEFIGNQKTNIGIFGEDFYIHQGLYLIENCKFQTNSNDKNGGSVYFNFKRCNNCSLIIRQSYFERNVATKNGGAIYIDFLDAKVEIEGCQFSQNQGINGSSVYIKSAMDAKIDFSEFYDHSGNYGGGVYSKVKLFINNSIFDNNVATISGGGILLESSVFLENVTFNDNTAYQNGGALMFLKGNIANFTARNCFFNDNKAYSPKNIYTGNGGAINLVSDNLDYFEISDSVFIENRAKYSYSIFYVYSKSKTLTTFIQNNVFKDNVFTITTAKIKCVDLIYAFIRNNKWINNNAVNSILAIESGGSGTLEMKNENITGEVTQLYGFLYVKALDMTTINNIVASNNQGSVFSFESTQMINIKKCKAFDNKGTQNSTDLIKVLTDCVSFSLDNSIFRKNEIESIFTSQGGSVIVSNVSVTVEKEVNFHCFHIMKNILQVNIFNSSLIGCGVEINDLFPLATTNLKIENSIFRKSFIYYNSPSFDGDISLEKVNFYDGYGMFFEGFNTFLMNELHFYNNAENDLITKNHTGGVNLYYRETVTKIEIKNSEFRNNVFKRGGGLCLQSVEFTDSPGDVETRIEIDNKTYFFNNSAEFGGAIFVSSKSLDNYKNLASINNNRAKYGGGGTYFDYFGFSKYDKKKIIGNCSFNYAQNGGPFLFPPSVFNIRNDEENEIDEIKCKIDKKDTHKFKCDFKVNLIDAYEHLIRNPFPGSSGLYFQVKFNNTNYNQIQHVWNEDSYEIVMEMKLDLVSSESIETNLTMILDHKKKHRKVVKFLIKEENNTLKIVKIVLIVVLSITLCIVFFIVVLIILLLIYIKYLQKKNFPNKDLSDNSISWAFGIRSKRKNNEKEPLLINDSLYGEIYYNEEKKQKKKKKSSSNIRKRGKRDLEKAIQPFKLFNFWNNSSVNSSLQVLLNIPEFVAEIGISNSMIGEKIIQFCRTGDKTEYREVLEYIADRDYSKTTSNESGEPSHIIEGIVNELGKNNKFKKYIKSKYKNVFMCDKCNSFTVIEEKEEIAIPILSCPMDINEDDISFERVFLHQNEISKTKQYCNTCKEKKIGGVRKIWNEVPKFLFVKVSENGIKSPFLNKAKLNFENLTNKDIELSEGTYVNLFCVVFYQNFGGDRGQYFSCLRKTSFHYEKRELIEMYFSLREMSEKEKNDEEYELKRMSKREIFELIPKVLKDKWFYCNDSTVKEIHQKVVEKYFSFRDEYKSIVLVFESRISNVD